MKLKLKLKPSLAKLCLKEEAKSITADRRAAKPSKKGRVRRLSDFLGKKQVKNYCNIEVVFGVQEMKRNHQQTLCS